MKNQKWHLDFKYHPDLFIENWPADSHDTLLKIFKVVDDSNKPVLSMLPAGVSPAGAAVAASIYFLPCITSPPKPHCRIAVYPGLHFSRALKEIKFKVRDLKRADEDVRIQKYEDNRKSPASPAPFFGPEGAWQKIIDRDPAEIVFYHWISCCRIGWVQSHQCEYKEIIPRDYLGRGDPYSATIDLILTDKIDYFSDEAGPYDLLIYCPYFHSSQMHNEDFSRLFTKIQNFRADRKLIIARSPFDKWSRMIEDDFKINGLAVASTNQIGLRSDDGKSSGIKFVIVNQFLDIKEACHLYVGLQRLRNSHGFEIDFNEVYIILRKLLVSLVSVDKDRPSLVDNIERLRELLYSYGMNDDNPVMKLILAIKTRLVDGLGHTKVSTLLDMACKGRSEVWVTKDIDRQVVNDIKESRQLDLNVRLADKWMAVGTRDLDSTVMLLRSDRVSDLDLVSYLKSGDIVVMSAWEAVFRSIGIVQLWDRSDKWRDTSVKLGVIPVNFNTVDPVQDLANYLTSIVTPVIEEVMKESTEPLRDLLLGLEADSQDVLISSSRDELLERTGGRVYSCRELLLEGNVGVFIRGDDDIQVIDSVDERSESDGEIMQIKADKLQKGMALILFKDSERNSMFDILMDQLGRSERYMHDAEVVRDWKQKLRGYALTRSISVSRIVELLEDKGHSFDEMTVRSWVYGSTMAPLRRSDLSFLIDSLGLDCNSDLIYRSVVSLRKVARKLGKILNQIILARDLSAIDQNSQATMRDAGIDIDELSSLVEARRIIDVLPRLVDVERGNIKKLFSVVT